MKISTLKNAFIQSIIFLLLSFSLHAQEKEVNVQEQTENLISSLERISISEIKLQIIKERTASIPKEELEQSEIPMLIQKYNNEKIREERQVISIEHFLKKKNIIVEIPEGKFNKLSDSVKSRIKSDSMYVIGGSNK